MDGNLVGDLGPAAKLLVDRLCAGISAPFKPLFQVYEARGEAKSSLVRVKGELAMEAERLRTEPELAELRNQAELRTYVESLRHQQNLNTIATKAAYFLSEEARPSDIDQDWLDDFSDKSKRCGKEEVQTLWARVLAGEANKPGSFSKRTLSILRDLDKDSAQHFAKLARSLWAIETVCQERENQIQLIPINKEPITDKDSEEQLSHDSCAELASQGLIVFDISTFYIQVDSELAILRYFERSMEVVFDESGRSITCGRFALTKSGRELIEIVEEQPINGLFETMVERLNKMGTTKSVREITDPD